jgi:nifR3 family TIM-barrel protein
MLKLGRITLDVPFFQASLSGYSDYAMRQIARDFGVPLTFTGVMLAKTVVYPKMLNSSAVRPGDDEHPIGAQILGDEPVAMVKAAKTLESIGYDLIDLNFACPAPKVLRRQRGGFLLKNPERVMEIYKAVKDSVGCPVTMKLRTGFDESDCCLEDFQDIVSRAADAKVDALIVHPRNVCQRFTGTADWQLLAELKKRFPQTTIIGSGDLFSVETIKQNMQETGVDGVAIARGAIGNPWIFSQLRASFDGGAIFVPPTLEQQGEVILKHFNLVCGLYEHKKAIMHFRKFIVAYCRLHPLRKKAQKALFSANNAEQILDAIRQWYNL